MRLLIFVALSGLLLTCNSAEVKPRINQSSFFPLEIGRSWSYRVNSFHFNGKDTIFATFNLKVVTTQVTQSLTGAEVYHFEVKDDSLGSWRFLPSWSVWIEEGKEIIVQEGNTRYVRLIFPFTETTTWNLNKYNTASNKSDLDICTVKFLDTDKKVIQITEEDDSIVVDKRFGVYRAGIGLERRRYLKNNYGFRDLTGEAYVKTSDSFLWEIIDSQ